MNLTKYLVFVVFFAAVFASACGHIPVVNFVSEVATNVIVGGIGNNPSLAEAINDRMALDMALVHSVDRKK
jgi:hypothetical protein